MCQHEGVVPLHRAVRLGDIEMVTSLLEQMQTDILPAILSKQHAPYLYTALHWCAVYGQSDAEDGPYAQIAELLIRSGCGTSLRNNRGKTVWDLAQKFGATSVLKTLGKHASGHDGCKQHTELHS